MLGTTKPPATPSASQHKAKSSSKHVIAGAKKDLGAPSQHKQGSRKGKRAWRKNVDIDEVEEGMEGLRAEERVTGTILQKKKDDELFQIDVEGDDRVRKSLPRFSPSQLTSTKILAQRSAVPAIFSRPATTIKRKPGTLSHDEKARLLRVGKRMRKGPLNSYVDPTEFGAGSAILEVSEAVKNSGGYDAWAEDKGEEEEIRDGLETVQKVNIKRPEHRHPRDIIELPAITEPHQGTSYNPPVEAHTELILKAHEVEEKKAKEAEKMIAVKERIGRVFVAKRVEEGVPEGMTVDEGAGDDVEGEAGVGETPIAKKSPERKTKQQKAKAARLRAEKRALLEKSLKKRMLHTLSSTSIKSLRGHKSLAADVHAQRQAAEREKLRTHGMKGRRLGKHSVPEGNVDVQLGEDLSESLRALKPEGNLFRDRFQSLQQRALVEPRVPVLPTKRKFKVKEYEKHAWKRFE